MIERLEQLEKRAELASDLLGEACKRGHLRMCVPARPGQDDDLVLASMIKDQKVLLAVARAAEGLIRMVSRHCDIEDDDEPRWVALRDALAQLKEANDG